MGIRQNRQAHSIQWTGAFAKIDRRICQNEPKCACMILRTCAFIPASLGFLQRGPPGLPAHGPGGPELKTPSPLEYIPMYGVSCMRWSILANAPIHFGEFACSFYQMSLSMLATVSRYSGIPVFRYSGTWYCSSERVYTTAFPNA